MARDNIGEAWAEYPRSPLAPRGMRHVSILLIFLILSVCVAKFPLPASYASSFPPSSPPQVEIKQPSICLNRYQIGQQIQVNGIASDNASTIRLVEVQIQTLSGIQTTPYRTATPLQNSDWSRWTVTLNGTNLGPQLVLAHIVDKAGRENWDQVKIQVVPSGLSSPTDGIRKKSVAVLEPVFTEAAYGFSNTELGNFYAFYSKYNNADPGTTIQTDLNLLTGDIPREPDHQFSTPLVENLRVFDPSEQINLISDIDVNNGYIIDANGNNLYDAIFLLHDEYVTQQEYSNYEKFVKNGGNLVALDGNIFYAQVKYDPASCTVTLVEGHDWQFDGTEAHKSVSEKFLDENRKFIGSNFIVNDIKDPVTFGNNPFNYTHFEENYLSNQNDSVLINYDAKIGTPSTSSENSNPNTSSASGANAFLPGDLLGSLFGSGSSNTPTNNFSNKEIATYELQPYGTSAGRVIMMGIYSQNLLHTPTFLRYLQNVIFPISFGEVRKLTINGSDANIQLYFKVPERYSIESVKWNLNSSSIQINVGPVNNYVLLDSSDTRLVFVLPNQLIDTNNNDGVQQGSSRIVVKIDNGSISNYTSSLDEIHTGMSIDLPLASNQGSIGSALYPHQVDVTGLRAVPDFSSTLSVFVAAIMIMIAIPAVSSRVLSRISDGKKWKEMM